MSESGSKNPSTPSYQGPFVPKVATTDSNAIYHEVSPKFVLAAKILGVISVLMVLFSFISTLVKGAGNHNLYLLTTNLLISGFVGGVIAWWYRSGDIAADKTWYLCVVCGVIIFQCITTDIYAFHSPTVPVTPAPPISTTKSIPPSNITNSSHPGLFDVTQPTAFDSLHL